MLLSEPLLANLRLTDTRETEVGALFLFLMGQLANMRPLNTDSLMLLLERLLANLRLTDSRETEVGAVGDLPSSLGSASSKFEARKYSAPDSLMLLSDLLLANLRLTDTRETEVGLSSFFS
jgi:hypothetical protein